MPQSGSTTLLRPQDPGAVVVIAQHARLDERPHRFDPDRRRGAVARRVSKPRPMGSGVAARATHFHCR
jgi:hypothetical protein